MVDVVLAGIMNILRNCIYTNFFFSRFCWCTCCSWNESIFVLQHHHMFLWGPHVQVVVVIVVVDDVIATEDGVHHQHHVGGACLLWQVQLIGWENILCPLLVAMVMLMLMMMLSHVVEIVSTEESVHRLLLMMNVSCMRQHGVQQVVLGSNERWWRCSGVETFRTNFKVRNEGRGNMIYILSRSVRSMCGIDDTILICNIYINSITYKPCEALWSFDFLWSIFTTVIKLFFKIYFTLLYSRAIYALICTMP